MIRRLSFSLLVVALLAPVASAQVVRFQTTLGNFDMVLNPTNNAQLQGYVDNFLQYVETERYKGSWVTRASHSEDGSNFVLQMGGFFSHTKRPFPTVASSHRVFTFDPVDGVPAQEVGLSNTLGTVALALPSDNSGPLQDAGTNQFFINMASNTFLDPNFTVFAAVSDLTTINQIMALETFDRTADDQFPTEPENGNFQEVPITADGKQVFIRRAFVLTDSLSIEQARANVRARMSASAASSGGAASALGLPLSAGAVPEPTAGVLALFGLGSLALRRRRR